MNFLAHGISWLFSWDAVLYMNLLHGRGSSPDRNQSSTVPCSSTSHGSHGEPIRGMNCSGDPPLLGAFAEHLEALEVRGSHGATQGPEV
eukprot:s2076_g15.t1